MFDHPSYTLSDPARIQLIRDMLVLWLRNNSIELWELNRAIAMLMRESDDRRKQEAIARRQH